MKVVGFYEMSCNCFIMACSLPNVNKLARITFSWILTNHGNSAIVRLSKPKLTQDKDMYLEWSIQVYLYILGILPSRALEIYVG
jgi:hypothetical protein